MDEIYPIDVTRRFILGLQGLWPSRRWSGKPGVLQAFEQIQALQMDPLNILARSHDLALHARVDAYRPDHLWQLLYEDRLLFDYGGGLFIYPVRELPYWRVSMRNKGRESRWQKFATANQALIAEIQAQVEQGGPVRNRDFKDRARVESYRARKDSGLALYYLWLTGDLMTSSRENFEKVYDLSSRLAPPELLESASEEEAAVFFGRKVLAFHGLVTAREWRNFLGGCLEIRLDPQDAAARLESFLVEGTATRIRVEGWRDPLYLLAGNKSHLDAIASGGVPEAWQSSAPSTLEEARFLAPLEIVSARGRAKTLFGFDYIWEVYKPAEKRRWGYYTLPILYGDRLPARIDMKLDRPSRCLDILGFWLEDWANPADPGFACALANGLASLAAFTSADRVDLSGIHDSRFRQLVEDFLLSLS